MKTVVTALFLLASAALADTPISFQKLPEGDTLKVSYSSRGCFHSSVYEFEFRRAKELTAKVSRIEERWNKEKDRREITNRIPLGTVTLTGAEVAGLDRLLAFYRTKQNNGCTTVDEITLKQQSGGAVKTTESFVDASCATDKMAGITRFGTIAKRAEPAKK